MSEKYSDRAGSIVAPARHAFAATPSDVTDLSEETRAIYVGGSGDLSVVMVSGAEAMFAGVVAGTVLPVRAIRIKATGTTATQLLGLA
jgi:hypothetical protein